jgi:hypothetical protein
VTTCCDYCDTLVEINQLGHASHTDPSQDRDHDPEVSI